MAMTVRNRDVAVERIWMYSQRVMGMTNRQHEELNNHGVAFTMLSYNTRSQ